jgi:hypothetical protein
MSTHTEFQYSINVVTTTPRYRFHDPLVGSFSRWSLYE